MNPFVCENQKTITREGRIAGIGLHTGEPAEVLLKPAPAGYGIQFFRDGARAGFLSDGAGEGELGRSLRSSVIGSEKTQIMTVEHLLAALAGLEITNVAVQVKGPEIPILDGSALGFVDFLKGLGETLDQKVPKPCYEITEPIFFYDGISAICAYPSETPSIAYVLDYGGHPYLCDQHVDYRPSPERFESEIAPARTFCTEEEAADLKAKGFGRGATPENTMVIARDGSHASRLRFPDECARHKVLDIVGDLALAGCSIAGRVVGIRSGHALNRRLAHEIRRRRLAMSAHEDKASPHFREMGVEEIKAILPHRYPFLLVDRIIEMGELGIVGIKNVTATEPFFIGHFPQKAVMPGVLMIEALAQTAGVLMLSKEGRQGKLAYLVSIDNARFRKLVVPGDQLRLEAQVLKVKSKIVVIKGVAKVGADPVCEAEIMFSFTD